MQNMLMFADAIRAQGAFYLPLGDSKVSWVDARDIAEVGVVALTGAGHENKEYPITGGEAINCAGMAQTLSVVLGKTVNYVDVSLAAAKEGMTGAGMPEKLANMMNELYALGPAGHLVYVGDTVERVTGHPPRSFHQFVENHAAAFKGLDSTTVRSAPPPGRRTRSELDGGPSVSRLPTLFIPHGGGPCFFMEWNPPDTWSKISVRSPVPWPEQRWPRYSCRSHHILPDSECQAHPSAAARRAAPCRPVPIEAHAA